MLTLIKRQLADGKKDLLMMRHLISEREFKGGRMPLESKQGPIK